MKVFVIFTVRGAVKTCHAVRLSKPEAEKLVQASAQVNAALEDPAVYQILEFEAPTAEFADASGLALVVDPFLADQLRLWKSTGEPGPMNELQSIHAWLMHLTNAGQEDTVAVMRRRMALLLKTAATVGEYGAKLEDLFGIFDDRSREEVQSTATKH